jgi:hypothetical protein
MIAGPSVPSRGKDITVLLFFLALRRRPTYIYCMAKQPTGILIRHPSDKLLEALKKMQTLRSSALGRHVSQGEVVLSALETGLRALGHLT